MGHRHVHQLEAVDVERDIEAIEGREEIAWTEEAVARLPSRAGNGSEAPPEKEPDEVFGPLVRGE